MKQNIENASISLVSSICQEFIRKTMLSYFLSLGNELTNWSLKSSEFCGEKYGGFRGKWEVTVQNTGFLFGAMEMLQN